MLLPLPIGGKDRCLDYTDSAYGLPSLSLTLTTGVSDVDVILSAALMSILISVLLVYSNMDSLSTVVESVSLFQRGTTASSVLPLPVCITNSKTSDFYVAIPVVSTPTISREETGSSVRVSTLCSPISAPVGDTLSKL